MNDNRIDLYTSIVPNKRQLIIQEMRYYAFVHYGINTFTNREWGNGKESETLFNPKKQWTIVNKVDKRRSKIHRKFTSARFGERPLL